MGEGPQAAGDAGRAARMRLRVRAHHLPGRTGLRRVLVSTALSRTNLSPLLWEHSGALFSCRADLLRLGALFRLAATSPHSAVFLPLRANAPSGFAAAWSGAGWSDGIRPLHDLVVLRDDVQLRPAAWPGLRARLGRGPHPGSALSLRAPAPRARIRQPRPWNSEDLRVDEYARTVFMSARPIELFDTGDELTWCADQVATSPDIHRFGGPALFSQLGGPDRRPGSRRDRSWECMVLAEDQHFRHR